MQLLTTINKQLTTLKQLKLSAKLYISVIVLYGIFISGWSLFFNFYILARGFDLNFLGLANSMTPAAILVGGIPMGMLSDRIGRKRALILGQILLVASTFIVANSTNGMVILTALFICGIGEASIIVSEAPMLVKLSTRETRGLLFSLNYGLATLAGMLGSALGGQLPLWLERWFGTVPETAASYQGVLIACISFNILAFIPLWFMKVPEGETNGEEPADIEPETGQKPNGKGRSRLQSILHNPMTYKLMLPNLGFGIGAALFIPYLNLFFVNKFSVNDQLLGFLFSMGSLTTGIGMLMSSYLAKRVGSRIRAILLVQTSSIIFMMMLGFSPWLGLAMVGYLIRGALMNTGAPLYDSFAMDQVIEREQGTFNSLLMMSFETGWAIGPFLSSLLQEAIGFQPIFLISGGIYTLAMLAFWIFFRNKEDIQQIQLESSLT